MAGAVKGSHCLNCGHPTGEDTYCAQCGQLNDTRRLSFWELVNETLSNFLALDGKIFRTFWLVLSAPGKVAADFKEGKRMRYMNPIRFYFLSSLLLITSIQLQREKTKPLQFKTARVSKVEQLQKKKDLNASLELARISRDFRAEADKGIFNRLDYMTDYLEESPQSSKAEVLGALALEQNFWNEFLFEQAVKIEQSRQAGDFSRFNRAFVSKLFWILFLFIPFFGLILQLFYWRRDFYYPEHLFFTLYQQSLFFTFYGLYNLFFPDTNWIGSLIFFGFAIHLYIAMRRFYQQSWRKTLLKYMLINISGLLAFSLFFILSAVVVFILL